MTYKKTVTEYEFDSDGNVTKKTVTEYAVPPLTWEPARGGYVDGPKERLPFTHWTGTEPPGLGEVPVYCVTGTTPTRIGTVKVTGE